MRPWLLPVTALVIGVVWILWLASGNKPTESPAPPQPPSSQALARHDAPAPAKSPAPAAPKAVPEPAGARSAKRSPSSIEPAGAGSAKSSRSSIEPAVQLTIQSPVSATVGEGFDVRVSLAARQPVGRIAVEIVYDPTLLKARTLEEIDHSQRGPAEPAFRTEQAIDGQIEVVLSDEPGIVGNTLPASAALVQFEPLSSGRAQIRIINITVLDPSNRSLTFAATGRESEVVIR